MTHHLMPNTQPSIDPPPLRQFPRLEASLPMLDLDRRLQFAQRLAVLIRRMQTQHQVRTKEEPPDES
jgi:hypothetical protein